MDRHFDEGVAGAASAVLFTLAGSVVLAWVPAFRPPQLLVSVTALALAFLGAAVGAGLMRLATRHLWSQAHADYAEPPTG